MKSAYDFLRNYGFKDIEISRKYVNGNGVIMLDRRMLSSLMEEYTNETIQEMQRHK